MSTRHLVEGDPLPEAKPGLLRLYNMRFCPYAQRTLMVLVHKGVPFEIVNVNLKKKPSWFSERNPSSGTVPVLELDDKLIQESMVSAQWLDDVYRQKNLTPTDPYQKAQQNIQLEAFRKVITNYYKVALGKTEVEKEEAKKAIYSGLEYHEKNLDTPFFGGDQPMMADFMMWPHTERLMVLKSWGMLELSEDRFPKFMKWVERMQQVPAVKETMLSLDLHKKFAQSYMQGAPQFDFDE